MIRLLLALAWMRWRAFVNGVSRRRKGSRSSRLSGWLSAGSTAIVTALGLLLAALLAVAGFAAGVGLARGGEAAAAIGMALRMLGFTALIMAIVSPLQSGADGRVPTRLMLVPVPMRRLHAAGILASALDPLVVLTVPALFAVLLGVAAGGAPAAALLALPAALGLAAFIVGFDALVGFATQLLLRDRRRGEAASMVILLVVMVLGFLPALLAMRLDPDLREPRDDRPRSAWTSVREVEAAFGAVDALPPGLFARSLQRGLEGRPAAALGHAAVLAVLAGAALAGAGLVHARLLSEPGRTSRRRAALRFPSRALRLPGVRPATAAVASASARTILRTVRGKIATFTPPLVAGIMALVFRRAGDEAVPLASTLVTATGLFSWSVALTLLNQQPFVLNAHAVDRAGFTLTALQPATAAEIVRGKMLGHGALLGLAMVPAAAVSLAVGSARPASAWATALLCALAAWLLHAPVALLLSALFPKPADMSKLGGQQPHGAAGLLGALSILAAMLLPRAAGWAGLAAGGPWAQALGAGALALAAAAAAVPMTALAASVLEGRRESIAMAAQGR